MAAWRAHRRRGRTTTVAGRGALVLGLGVALALAGCSSDRDAGPGRERTTSPTSTSTTTPSDSTAPAESSGSTGSSTTGVTSTAATTSTSGPVATPGAVTGVAIAGTAGGVEASGTPFASTDPFAEAVRLSDGTCVGWPDSKGGSTAGLAVGAPVTILAAETNDEIGTGTIQASHWADVSQGGGQWNCFFDFSATITGTPPAEFRVKVASLEPWLARPDPTAPGTFAVSVSTDASIGLIPSCPAVPQPPATSTSPASTTLETTTTTIAPTTVPGPPVTGWNAVGQYWSNGVASLCTAGLPVTAIARPCRPSGVGSEYIVSVVDSEDSTVTYANGAAVPLGTALTVVVATGRPCG